MQRVHGDAAFSREMEADASGGRLRSAREFRDERAAHGDVYFADVALEVDFRGTGAFERAGGLVAIDEREAVGGCHGPVLLFVGGRGLAGSIVLLVGGCDGLAVDDDRALIQAVQIEDAAVEDDSIPPICASCVPRDFGGVAAPWADPEIRDGDAGPHRLRDDGDAFAGLRGFLARLVAEAADRDVIHDHHHASGAAVREETERAAVSLAADLFAELDLLWLVENHTALLPRRHVVDVCAVPAPLDHESGALLVIEELDGVAGWASGRGKIEADLHLFRQRVEASADVRAVAVAVAESVACDAERAVEVAPRIAFRGGFLRGVASVEAVRTGGLHPRLPVARAVPHRDLAVLAKVDRADACAFDLEMIGDRGFQVELPFVEEDQFAGQPVAVAESHGCGGRHDCGFRAVCEQDAREAAHRELDRLRAFDRLPLHLLIVARAQQRAVEFVAIAEDQRVAALAERLVAGRDPVRKLDGANGRDRQRDFTAKGRAHPELAVAEAERGHVELPALREPHAGRGRGRRIASPGTAEPDEERNIARDVLAGKSHRVRADRLQASGLPLRHECGGGEIISAGRKEILPGLIRLRVGLDGAVPRAHADLRDRPSHVRAPVCRLPRQRAALRGILLRGRIPIRDLPAIHKDDQLPGALVLQDAVARFLWRIFLRGQHRGEVLPLVSVVRVPVDVVRLEAEIHGPPRISAGLETRLDEEREPAHSIAAIARGKLDFRPIRKRLEASRERHRGPRDERTIRIIPRARASRPRHLPACEAHRPGRPLVRVGRCGLGKMEPLDPAALDLEHARPLDRQPEFPSLHRAEITREPVAACQLHRGVRLLRRRGLVPAENDPPDLLRIECDRRGGVRALPGDFVFSKCCELSVELRAIGEFEHLIARGIRLRAFLRPLRGACEHHAAIHDFHALGIRDRTVVEDVRVESLDHPDLLRTACHRGECAEHGQRRGKNGAHFHQRS